MSSEVCKACDCRFWVLYLLVFPEIVHANDMPIISGPHGRFLPAVTFTFNIKEYCDILKEYDTESERRDAYYIINNNQSLTLERFFVKNGLTFNRSPSEKVSIKTTWFVSAISHYNKIYLIGGSYGQPSNQILEIDSTWRKCEISLLEPMYGLCSASYDSNIIISGGYNGSHLTRSIRYFNPAAQILNWHFGKELPFENALHSCTIVLIQKIPSLFIAGGSTTTTGNTVQYLSISRVIENIGQWTVIKLRNNHFYWPIMASHDTKMLIINKKDKCIDVLENTKLNFEYSYSHNC